MCTKEEKFMNMLLCPCFLLNPPFYICSLKYRDEKQIDGFIGKIKWEERRMVTDINPSALTGSNFGKTYHGPPVSSKMFTWAFSSVSAWLNCWCLLQSKPIFLVAVHSLQQITLVIQHLSFTRSFKSLTASPSVLSRHYIVHVCLICTLQSIRKNKNWSRASSKR